MSRSLIFSKVIACSSGNEAAEAVAGGFVGALEVAEGAEVLRAGGIAGGAKPGAGLLRSAAEADEGALDDSLVPQVRLGGVIEGRCAKGV